MSVVMLQLLPLFAAFEANEAYINGGQMRATWGQWRCMEMLSPSLPLQRRQWPSALTPASLLFWLRLLMMLSQVLSRHLCPHQHHLAIPTLSSPLLCSAGALQAQAEGLLWFCSQLLTADHAQQWQGVLMM